jgi:hypothetical protein
VTGVSGYKNQCVTYLLSHIDVCRVVGAPPTLSRGMRRSSEPCFKKTSPAVWAGLIPTPSSVMIALVSGDDLNCSAANLTTAVNGVESGTLRILYGNFGSDVSVILKETLTVSCLGWLVLVVGFEDDFESDILCNKLML